ncbi:DUF4153 domain-containing protein [Paenibacillus sp. NPDC058174]|uniref:DUF4153 domain-containing protein n=1 Tax=Paenibacillus sp. NPDC058174 TaxID=3346366 RepID=UPI0036D76E67
MSEEVPVLKPDEAFADRKGAVRALLMALAAACIHQYLFFEHTFGISYPIFIGIFYALLLGNARGSMRRLTGIDYFCFAAVALLALTYVLFANPIFYGLNFIAVPVLIGLHTVYLFGRDKGRTWWDIRLIPATLEQLFIQTFGHWATAFSLLRSTTATKIDSRHKKTTGSVLIGLAIAGPLLIIVTTLLGSADGVFQGIVNAIPDSFGSFSIGEAIGRLMWLVILSLLLFGFVWGFVSPRVSHRARLAANWKEAELQGAVPLHAAKAGSASVKADPLIIATVLVAINAVYILFVVIQFSYLFGMLNGHLPEGMTYAEYARGGFFELVIVTSINFAIMLGTLVFSDRSRVVLAKVNNVLLYVLVSCSGVMLVSAYKRLVLYEQAYGYTYIRFLVHAFMIYLAVLLIIAGLRIAISRIPLARFYIVISIAAYVLINYIGMDRMIAERNIERINKITTITDISYLDELSADVVPLLLQYAAKHPELEKGLKQREEELQRRDSSWQAYNWASARAKRQLSEHFTTK